MVVQDQLGRKLHKALALCRNEISTLDMAKSGNQSNAGPPQEGKQLLRAPQRMQRQVQRSVSQKFDRSASFRRQEMELRARRKSEAGAAGGDATPREQTWQEMAEESIDEEAEEEVEEGETTEEAPEALERPSAAVQSMDEAAPSAPLMAKPSRYCLQMLSVLCPCRFSWPAIRVSRMLQFPFRVVSLSKVS